MSHRICSSRVSGALPGAAAGLRADVAYAKRLAREDLFGMELNHDGVGFLRFGRGKLRASPESWRFAESRS